MRSTSSPHASQRMRTSSTHGRRSSSRPVDRACRARHELRLRPDHVQMPARARIERERKAVVATARDVPVAHVPQPVVHALAHVLGRPLDRRVRLEQRLAQLVDSDEPVVGDAPDERRVAAPAVRVAVQVDAGFEQIALLGEAADDLVCRLGRREPVQPAVVRRRTGRPRRRVRAPAVRERRPSSKSSWPAPGAMWTIPVPSSSETSSHGMTRCSTSPPGPSSSNGPR